MKAVVDRLGRHMPLDVDYVDISGNVELEALYGEEIPVLLSDGQKAAKYRVNGGDAAREADTVPIAAWLNALASGYFSYFAVMMK